jgi:hypothetical protein
MNMRQKQAIFYNESSIKGKTLFFFSLLFQVSELNQESEGSCICVLEISILLLSTILLFDFEIVLTVWYFLFLILLTHYIFNLHYVLNGTNQNATNGNSNSSYWHIGLGHDLVMTGILYNVTARWPIMKVSLLYSV